MDSATLTGRMFLKVLCFGTCLRDNISPSLVYVIEAVFSVRCELSPKKRLTI